MFHEIRAVNYADVLISHRPEARAAGSARVLAGRGRSKITRAKRYVLLFRFSVFIAAFVDEM